MSCDEILSRNIKNPKLHKVFFVADRRNRTSLPLCRAGRRQSIDKSAPGGIRTHTLREQRSLNPVRLPVPPLEHSLPFFIGKPFRKDECKAL